MMSVVTVWKIRLVLLLPVQRGNKNKQNDKNIVRPKSGHWAHLYNLTSIKAEKITAQVLMVQNN